MVVPIRLAIRIRLAEFPVLFSALIRVGYVCIINRPKHINFGGITGEEMREAFFFRAKKPAFCLTPVACSPRIAWLMLYTRLPARGCQILKSDQSV